MDLFKSFTKGISSTLVLLLVGTILMAVGITYQIGQTGNYNDFQFTGFGIGFISSSNSPYQTIQESIDSNIESIDISIRSADNIEVKFVDDDKYYVDIEAQLDNYSYKYHNNKLKVDFTGSWFNFVIVQHPHVKNITVNVPKSYRGEIKINGTQYTFNLKSEELIEMDDLKFNGIENTINLKNIVSDVDLNGTQNTLNAENFGGELKSNGVDSKIYIESVLRDLELKSSGVSSVITINEGEHRTSYKIKASGVSSSYSYYDLSNNSVLGDNGFNHTESSSNVLVDIKLSGIDSKVYISE